MRKPVNARCPDCQVDMEPGFMTDRGYTSVGPTEWVDSPPKMGMWTRLKNKKVFTMTAYRCPSCGWVKPYARP